MEFRQSTPDKPPPPLPPHLWLQQQQPPPPLPQPLSNYCDFSAQATRASCIIPPGLGLGNDYLSLGKGHSVEHAGQWIGRANENFEMLNNFHHEIPRDSEKDTRKSGCTNHGSGLGFNHLSRGIGQYGHIGQGIGRANENFEMLNNIYSKIQRDPEKDTRKSCVNPGFGFGCNVEYFGQGTGRTNENVDMLYNINPEMQREAEKQKIREEIIAGEMARRRELEAEVRAELRVERELALRMKGGNTFDRIRVPMEPWGKSLTQEVEGLSLDENDAMSVKESLRIQGRTQISGMDMLPFQRMSSESKVNETGQEKEKNILRAQPSADSAMQKEALVPATKNGYTVFGIWGVGNIEGKKVWRCFLCQVSATSEATLKQHFDGNKHRSKRDALKAEKSAAATGLGFHPEQQVEEKALHLEPLLPAPSAIVSAKPLDGNSGKEKFAFWCEMCNSGTNNKYLMEAHKNGKKHLSQLKKNVAFWCDLCKIGTRTEHIMETHLRGKKHLNMLREKAAFTASEQRKSSAQTFGNYLSL